MQALQLQAQQQQQQQQQQHQQQQQQQVLLPMYATGGHSCVSFTRVVPLLGDSAAFPP